MTSFAASARVAVLVCCTAKARSAQLSAWCLMPLGGPACDGMRVPPAMEPIGLYCTAADEQTEAIANSTSGLPKASQRMTRPELTSGASTSHSCRYPLGFPRIARATRRRRPPRSCLPVMVQTVRCGPASGTCADA